MTTSGTSTNGPQMSFVDFCKMTEAVLVSIQKELVVKGVVIDESVNKRLGELIIRSRRVINPQG
jgi:hypothetical protein